MFLRDYAAMLQCFLLLFKVSLRHTKLFFSPSISTDTSSMAGALKGITKQVLENLKDTQTKPTNHQNPNTKQLPSQK